MICLDNSEWMRNGDYPPTRIDAQSDAVNLICGAKPSPTLKIQSASLRTQEKPRQVLVTPTVDVGKILSSLHSVIPAGDSQIVTALRVAELSLKHTRTQHQRQRIILFVGSPVTVETKSLTSLAGKLKKNMVAVDVINFGEEADNTEKLEAFVNAVNRDDNSHLVR
eukprot:UN04434